MSTVVVTGAHGFLGRWVGRACAARGHLVRGVGHGRWPESEWRLWGLSSWHEADVTRTSLRELPGDVDAIVHCAGGGSVASSIADPEGERARTVGTTIELLAFLADRPAVRLVYPSSAAVYGSTREIPIRTDGPCRPISPYGEHKLAAENLIRAWAADGGRKAAIVRLFSAYGPGLRKQLLWDACRKARADDLAFGGTGRETRDLIHATDAAALLEVAIAHAASDVPTVNGGAGAGVTTAEIVSLILQTLGVARAPTFLGNQRPGDPEHYVAETGGATRWGWKPETPWRKGIPDYVRWFEGEPS